MPDEHSGPATTIGLLNKEFATPYGTTERLWVVDPVLVRLLQSSPEAAFGSEAAPLLAELEAHVKGRQEHLSRYGELKRAWLWGERDSGLIMQDSADLLLGIARPPIRHRISQGALIGLRRAPATMKVFTEPPSEPLAMTILSDDIRNSTELMLRAIRPHENAEFLGKLTRRIWSVITDNLGVFDKFTGDGVLAFFPDRFTGEHSVLNAIRAGAQCIDAFDELFDLGRYDLCPADAGLCVGLDKGPTYQTVIADGHTVVGDAVVHACRFTKGPKGKLLAGQRIHNALLGIEHTAVSLRETSITIRGMDCFAYEVSRGTALEVLPDPEWLKPR